MPKFILFIRGGEEEPNRLPPEEIQRVVGEYRAWAGTLAAQGKLVDGQKLKDDGVRIMRRAADGQVVCDGPYTETKETIGGYFIIEAADYAEAAELARGCPAFQRDLTIELRQFDA